MLSVLRSISGFMSLRGSIINSITIKELFTIRFKKIYIEITNICNLKCNFCPVTKREPKFMEPDEFGFILDGIKDYTEHIYLHIKGEPLLHPKLIQILDLAHDKGYKVNITTNGTLINKNLDMLLTRLSLRQINISLHSLEQNEDFENQKEYMDNILSFIEKARDKDVIVALRLWNFGGDTEHNINKNKYIAERLFNEFDLDYNILYEFSKKQGIKIRDRLYLNKDSEFIWPDLNNDFYDEKGFCYGLRDQLGILVDGTIIPCCLDGEGIINLGNIFKDKLDYILNSSRATNIYNSFSNRDVAEELCRRCGYKHKLI